MCEEDLTGALGADRNAEPLDNPVMYLRVVDSTGERAEALHAGLTSISREGCTAVDRCQHALYSTNRTVSSQHACICALLPLDISLHMNRVVLWQSLLFEYGFLDMQIAYQSHMRLCLLRASVLLMAQSSVTQALLSPSKPVKRSKLV